MSGNDLDAVSTQADKKHTKMWWITDLKLFGLMTAMDSMRLKVRGQEINHLALKTYRSEAKQHLQPPVEPERSKVTEIQSALCHLAT